MVGRPPLDWPFLAEAAINIDNVIKETLGELIIPSIETVADLPLFVCNESQAMMQGKSIAFDAVPGTKRRSLPRPGTRTDWRKLMLPPGGSGR